MTPGSTNPTTTVTDGSTTAVVNNEDVSTFTGGGFTAVPRTNDFMTPAIAAANAAYNSTLDAGRSAIDAARAAHAALRTYEGAPAAAVAYAPLVAAPAAADSAGTAGQIAYDATHIYVCVATNTWVRAVLATWP